jgi:Ca2+-binding RTX toxin-like protein
MYGNSDIQVILGDDGIGVLTNSAGEAVGYIYDFPGRENPVIQNKNGEIISLSKTGALVKINPVTGEETPVSYPGLVQKPAESILNIVDYQTTAVLSDVTSLIGAIKGGQPIPILASGIRLLNDLANPLSADGLSRTLSYGGLNTVNTVATGVLSLYNLQNAFKHGDALDKITATASTINFVNQAFFSSSSAAVAAGALSNQVSGILNGAGGVPGVLPVLGLINGIRSGDPIGIVQGLIGIFNPALLSSPLGWALMAIQALRMIFDDGPPEAWGTSTVVFDGAYGTQVETVGESFGKDRTQNAQQNALDYMKALIAQSQAANPGDPLGLIPQRMATITWRERRQSDPGYAINDVDSLTGAQRYPYLRYDDNGIPFSADPSMFQVDPTDPGQRIPFQQAMVMSALKRGALAPMWEVKTAKMQQDAGDPNAGLTEEERAAKAGLTSAVNAATNERDPGQFRPIIMDMNGDGTITTVFKTQANVTFDWDASGFQKKVAWAGQGEGFLFLDRNPNGIAESGKELMSNSMVADVIKGLRSLVWVDGNADGRITDLDPVFHELRVWQDNGDGVSQEGEAKKLAELGITEIDYQMGRFMRNGQYYALGSPELEADEHGTKVNVTPAGIRVESTNGEIKLYVTRVTSFSAGNDGFALPEDGDLAARTTPIPAVIAASLLLSNDEINGVNTDLTITSVGSAVNGTVTLDNDPIVGQAVYFTPNANYNGPASFQYTLTAPNGTTRTATVSVDVLPVNDIPVTTIQNDPNRPIYGYKTINYAIDDDPLDESGPVGYTAPGEPIYAPYDEPVHTPIYETVWDNENGFVEVVTGYSTSYIPRYTQIAADTPTSGHVLVNDPDGPAQVRYQILSQPVYGKATLDENTGAYSYVGLRPAGVRVSEGVYINPDTGAPQTGNTYSNRYGRDEEKFTDVFTVRVIDLTDPTGNTFIDKDIPVTHYGPRPLPEVQDGGKKPIAIDLNGDGFHFVDVNDSNVFFDVNGDGWRRKIAWNNPDDGFIAFDKNGDGKIDRFDEISFVPYKPDGQTDLEGLNAFDTNKDGVFNGQDADWSKFGVWQDANSNGITDPGEFKSLDQLGIASIALTSNGQFQVIDGQTVHGTASATKADGSTLDIADVTLRYKNVTKLTQPDGSTVEVQIPRFQKGQEFTGTSDKDLVFGTAGSDHFITGDGDDAIMDDGGDDLIEAGAGNDLIYSGSDNDYIDAGDGDDTVFAGAGNDLIFGGSGNDLLLGEHGNDVVFGGAGNDFISGGIGNDILSGNEGDDKLAGEDGYDVLFGQEGNDELYGHAGNDLLIGGAGNDILDGGEGEDQMEGEEGDDIYVVDSAADQVIELADAGIDTVMASISYTVGVNVENLTLTGLANLSGTGNAGNNVLVGNDGANVLAGGAGNDILDGGRGADTLIGGSGDDTYVVDNSGDTVVEQADEGVDTVRSRISYTLGANVENLTLIGIDATNATGNTQNNTLIGNAANNRLDGGVGGDEMRGGRGNDAYVVDNLGDQVIEQAGEGIDSVESSIDYTLTAHVENLRLTGTALRGTGNGESNVILGNALANILDGGAGADILAGGQGNDMYIVDTSDDVVIEAADSGVDTVHASADFTLAGNLENLVLTGANALSGTGNSLSNILTANNAGNVLSGSGGDDSLFGGSGQDRLDGGSGADQMAGGAGNDTYVVDSAGDLVSEEVDAGMDTVESSIDYTLGANVENLTLTGTANQATGNELSNEIRGNAETNIIDGASGSDAMFGGAGNDTYIVDNTADNVIEDADNGTDSVLASVSYSLSANVENLTLVGVSSIAGTGNELANVLTANDAGNTLSGMAGDDTLVGGAGDDVLDGGGGADTMSGGQGGDSYIVDHVGDTVAEQSSSGVDTVYASVSYSLSANVENMTMTGDAAVTANGNELDNLLIANSAGNALYGMEGNDALVGGLGADLLDGGAGADELLGGEGDDVYVADNSGDIVSEFFGAGNDTVHSSINYVLPENVENLILTGTAVSGTGNALDNTLTGNTQDNYLDGDIGADSMTGGEGDDTYIVDNAGDVISEQAGGGIELVKASVSYGLASNVENLTLTGSESLTGTGNELSNVIVANDAGNILLGLAGDDALYGGTGADRLDGGIGADEMRGRSGNDMYIVDDAGDLVIENADDGIELVEASIDYALTANVENLTLTGNAIRATGNELDNEIRGNAENNVIDGAAGSDRMIGGAGDDTYIADNSGDVVIEQALEGVDLVYSSANYTLSANVENLTMTGNEYLLGVGNELANVMVANSGNTALYGLSGNDTLWGGVGDDLLDGGEGDDQIHGGTGDDLLVGGAGNDVYRYAIGDGLETIQDMAGQDSVKFGPGLNLDNLALRIVSINGESIAQIRVLDENGDEQPDQGIDFAISLSAGGVVSSPIEKFILDDGQELVFDDLLIKQTTIYGTNKADVLLGDRNDNTVFGNNADDVLRGGTGHDVLYGENGADLIYGGGGKDRLYGGNQHDILYGEGGDDLLDGGNGDDILIDTLGNNTFYGGNGGDFIRAGSGNDYINADDRSDNGKDVVQAGEGNDVIYTGNGNDLVDAGSGDDYINAGSGSNWFAGGKGNDVIDAGSDDNLFAFNRGDGQDTIIGSARSSSIVSLGGIRYVEMTLSKSGNDLILGTGQNDSITLKDWYASQQNRSVGRLQVVIAGADYDASSTDKTKNRQVEMFDFGKVVQRFDAARAVDSANSTGWAVMNSLLDAHLQGSNTQALGGDLSFQYATNGTLAGIGLSAAQASLDNAAGLQNLKTREQLEQGTVRLA